MTDEQKAELREIIAGKTDLLLLRIESLAAASRPVEPDNAIGRMTRMEAISAKGVSEASLRSARTELSMLRDALARIDEPDFGECAVCGEPIPFGRLRLMPGATRCVGCADRA